MVAPGTNFDLIAVANFSRVAPITPLRYGHVAADAAEDASEVGQISATVASAGKPTFATSDLHTKVPVVRC